MRKSSLHFLLENWSIWGHSSLSYEALLMDDMGLLWCKKSLVSWAYYCTFSRVGHNRMRRNLSFSIMMLQEQVGTKREALEDWWSLIWRVIYQEPILIMIRTLNWIERGKSLRNIEDSPFILQSFFNQGLQKSLEVPKLHLIPPTKCTYLVKLLNLNVGRQV